jgi:DNA adenine methylase
MSPFPSPWVYPGSKALHWGWLRQWLIPLAVPWQEYREPFVGGGGSFLPLADHLAGWHHAAGAEVKPRVWINDVDPGVMAFWRAVRDTPEELAALVAGQSVRATADARAGHERWLKAYGGWGGAAGKHKRTNEKRVQRHRLAQRVRDCGRLFERLSLRITCGDFGPVIAAPGGNVYADPPYPRQGEYYRQDMTPQDHARLAKCLLKRRSPWLLSYGEADQSALLPYRGCAILDKPLSRRMSNLTGKAKVYNEIIICRHLSAERLKRLFWFGCELVQ